MSLIALLGTVENITFLFFYAKGAFMPSQTNKIYMLLASSDLVTAVVVPTLHALPIIFPHLAANCYFDMIRVQASAATVSLSAYLLCLLSYDRFLLVRRPTNPNIPKVHFALVLLAFLLTSIILPTFRFLPGNIGLIVHGVMVVVNSLFVFATVSVSYSNLLLILRFRPIPRTSSQFEQARITKISVLLIAVFTVTITPMIIFHILCLMDLKYHEALSKYYVFAIIMITLNSVLNPVLYYGTNSTLKTQVMNIVRKKSPGAGTTLRRSEAFRQKTSLIHSFVTSSNTVRAPSIYLEPRSPIPSPPPCSTESIPLSRCSTRAPPMSPSNNGDLSDYMKMFSPPLSNNYDDLIRSLDLLPTAPDRPLLHTFLDPLEESLDFPPYPGPHNTAPTFDPDHLSSTIVVSEL